MVGVLALQGDFAEHAAAMRRAGFATRLIRSPAQLAGLDALVLPGGESSTMIRLLTVEGLWEPLGAVLRSGLPVLATCAGAILLAERVEPEQRSYGLLPIHVVRNGYGRQLHSGTFRLESDVLPAGTTATFIRAPRIVDAGDCEVLARRDGDPVLVRRGPILAAGFHPELQPDHPVTRLFTAALGGAGGVQRHAPALP
ncbi:MAG: pyridoxal 5'-phosphate synthase glutaminase subunit PdxT [Planctomycetes bacterium]|nr:pyridoxal 5'-phosphate synthase glutaminase subunit PdxT [Planctomycetota bacterium]